MTKVQIRFALQHPLNDTLMRRVADAHAIYGVARVVPTESMDGIIVDYDASRLTPQAVESRLRRLGLPARIAG